MKENFYMVSESRLKDLLRQEAELEVLETDGVDNWPAYMAGAREYKKGKGCNTFDEVAEKELKRFSRIV